MILWNSESPKHQESKEKNKKCLLLAADLQRPAAVEQLKVLANQENIEVFNIENWQDPKKVVTEGMNYSKEQKFDCIIIDTAGRLHVDDVLMDELEKINKICNNLNSIPLVNS